MPIEKLFSSDLVHTFLFGVCFWTSLNLLTLRAFANQLILVPFHHVVHIGSTAFFVLVETYACGCALAIWQLQPPLGSLLSESMRGVWKVWSCRKRPNYVAIIFIITERTDPLFISHPFWRHCCGIWSRPGQVWVSALLCPFACLGVSWIGTIPPSSCWFACCYIWKLLLVFDWLKQQFSLIVPYFKVSTAF